MKEIQPSSSVKSVEVWVIKKCNNCALAHCSCKNMRKTLIALWHRWCAEIILDKNSPSIPLLHLPWHFELDLCSWLLSSFKVRDRNYLSVEFILRISEATVVVFHSWYKRTGLTLVQLKDSIVAISWHWFSFPCQPRKTLKQNLVVLFTCSCAGSLSNCFFICSLEIGFLWTKVQILAVFWRSFTNALILYLPQ